MRTRSNVCSTRAPRWAFCAKRTASIPTPSRRETVSSGSEPALAARVHPLFRRSALSDVGPSRRRDPRGPPSLDAGLRRRRPDLQRLLSRRRGHADFHAGDARAFRALRRRDSRRFRPRRVPQACRSRRRDRRARNRRCERHRDLRGAVFDLPAHRPCHPGSASNRSTGARSHRLRSKAISSRTSYREADLFALSRILHDWTEDKIARLLRRISDRLPARRRPADLREATRRRWSRAGRRQLQSLNMLVVHRRAGAQFGEYERLLRLGGFSQIEGRPDGNVPRCCAGPHRIESW